MAKHDINEKLVAFGKNLAQIEERRLELVRSDLRSVRIVQDWLIAGLITLVVVGIASWPV
jgi:hypothetical protein